MIERLAGPQTHICWTPDNVHVRERKQVVLVEEKELAKLELFFRLPMHQQLQKFESATRNVIKQGKVEYPATTYLLNLADTLKLAQNLAFSYFAGNLVLEEVF